MKKLDITVPLDSPGILVPHLTNDKYDSYNITKIKGALTNVIYKLSINYNGECKNYLVRIFGSKMNSLVDREDELRNIKMVPNEVGFVKILLPFNNGRVELFLDGYRSLSQPEMVNENFAKVVAKNFAILHFKSVPTKNVDLNRFDHGFVWEKIESWLLIIESPMGKHWLTKDTHSNINETLLCKDWSTFKNVILKYKKWLLTDYQNPSQSLLFCHNDTQQGNILVKESTCEDKEPIIKFIDYEYSGLNFIDFDLSNYLTECMHDYEVDSTESYRCDGSKYPKKEQILAFLDNYLTAVPCLDDSRDEDKLKHLYNSVIKWRAATQLFWALWTILQSGELAPSRDNKNTENPYDEYAVEALSIDGKSNTEEDCDEPFNYLGFSRDKLSFFWGDLLKFGIAVEENCIIDKIQYLDTEFI